MRKFYSFVLFCLSVVGLCSMASAQVTNTASGVATTISAGVGPAFDTGVGIGIAIVAVLLAIMAVRRGIKAR